MITHFEMLQSEVFVLVLLAFADMLQSEVFVLVLLAFAE